ncbi:MAG: 4-amino-4-deoxy-L-arabinose transferase [Croceitalea sp.]|nr:4-amino-4-deoxy-L-arabinose transferase [Croceitalea sp.]
MANQFPKPFFFYLGALFLLNLLQSAFTELIFDEAYYWYYAQQLSWGYFDHPPMVAFMIAFSNLFFGGELGVRFMSCLMSTVTIAIIWLLIDNPLKRSYIPHFFLVVFSMGLFNAYGFLTLPDTPLLFFTALFLWRYKHFLNHNSAQNALLLGLTMTGLMYSKYHAVLVILFVLLSNLKLIKNKYAWMAVGISLLCYLPHLNWLYENDFVSVNYHLSERPNQAYSFEGFTLGYILNLIVNFGLLFPWFYWALFKAKTKNPFNRALVYLSYGIILFFFISSFQRRTQAQWVIAMCIPMFVLAFGLLLENQQARKWMLRLSLLSLFVLLYARVGLVHQPLFPIVYETHGNKQWVASVEKHAGEVPVIFENSYRRAPMYAFYSGNSSFSLNNIYYRLNQYSIDGSEAKFQEKRIAYISKYTTLGDFTYNMPNGDLFYGRFIDNFESYRNLRCFIEGETIDLNKQNHLLKIYNPYDKNIVLSKIKFHVGYLNAYKQINEVLPLNYELRDNNQKELLANDTTYLQISMPKSKKEKPFYLKFAISENGLPPGINSNSISVMQ